MNTTFPPPLPPSLREPSTLFHHQVSLKRSIISAFWTIIALAVPLWWYTTSIKRLSLPAGRVHEQTQNHLKLPVTICFESSNVHLLQGLRKALEDAVSLEPEHWRGLVVDVEGRADCGKVSGSGVYTVIPRPGAPSIRRRTLYFPIHDVESATDLAAHLTSLLAPYSHSTDPDRRVAQYSPRYRLAFSLLNEDAAAGDAILSWKVQDAVKSHINPILRRLRVLHNFTIESQVQYHAPLAFSPRQIANIYAVSPEDLTVFVNSAEWTLSSSSSNDPVLHFVLFIPSSQRRPLHILATEDVISPSNAFLLPQWGGIVIHNPLLAMNGELPDVELQAVFSSFANQLLGLLGVPQLPSGSLTTDIISDWQLDALLRRRTLENASGSQDTLKSIMKLVVQIENMPVGEDVRDDVEGALDALTKMYDSSRTSLLDTFAYSAQSFGLASRAFFSPGMLALLYFPVEHKYGVYAPLFFSALTPLFVAALREFIAWRKESKARRQPEQPQAPVQEAPLPES